MATFDQTQTVITFGVSFELLLFLPLIPSSSARNSDVYLYIAISIYAEAGTITFILISDQIVDHCSKIDLRSYQDHMALK
jgi:hypothetical protein